MKVTVDIDGVLGKFIEEFIDFINIKHNSNFRLDETNNLKSFEIMFNLNQERVDSLLKEFRDVGGILKIKPIEGSVEGIEELAKYHELHIVTSRRKEMSGEDTIRWLDQYYPNKFKSISMKELDNIVEERGIFKRNKITEINPDFHIDDDIDHIECVKELPLKAIIYTQPWNKDYVDDKILRFNSWKEITSYFKNLPETGQVLSL